MSAPSTWTLRFTEWECGHHQQRPADIPGITSPEQARLILQAIGNAISQPGSCRAVLFSETHGYRPIYVTDDYVDPEFPEKVTPLERPVVICGDADTVAQIMGDGLLEARDEIMNPDLYAAAVWDGAEEVCAYQTVLTTLTREQVEAGIAARADAYPPQRELFELPPVFMDAAPILERLRTIAADQGSYRAEMDAEDAAAEGVCA